MDKMEMAGLILGLTIAFGPILTLVFISYTYGGAPIDIVMAVTLFSMLIWIIFAAILVPEFIKAIVEALFTSRSGIRIAVIAIPSFIACVLWIFTSGNLVLSLDKERWVTDEIFLDNLQGGVYNGKVIIYDKKPIGCVKGWGYDRKRCKYYLRYIPIPSGGKLIECNKERARVISIRSTGSCSVMDVIFSEKMDAKEASSAIREGKLRLVDWSSFVYHYPEYSSETLIDNYNLENLRGVCLMVIECSECSCWASGIKNVTAAYKMLQELQSE